MILKDIFYTFRLYFGMLFVLFIVGWHYAYIGQYYGKTFDFWIFS